jgi:hypothetical protein
LLQSLQCTRSVKLTSVCLIKSVCQHERSLHIYRGDIRLSQGKIRNSESDERPPSGFRQYLRARSLVSSGSRWRVRQTAHFNLETSREFCSPPKDPRRCIETTMLLASSLLLSLTAASAFAPRLSMARSSALHSAVESSVYTFTRSEEIFAEAQTVRACVSRRVAS